MSMSLEGDRASEGIAAPLADRDVPTPTLSVFDATMITVGIVIGAGIFQTPSLVAGIAGSPELMLLAWVLGGVLSLIGALTYAELATTYPSAGGDYTFLTRAYGKNVSFLFAWARSAVICTGSIALLGFILGDYLTRLFSLGEYSSAMYAALAVVLLTVINLIGLRGSSRMQNALTLIEITGVLLVAAAGMTLESSAPVAATASSDGAGAFGLAMVFVLLTFGGWNEAAFVSAEVRGGPRAIVRALVISIGIITLAYLIFVASVLHGLGFEQLKSSQAVGIDVIERALGPFGGQLLGVIVAIAALTSMNSTILVGARSNYSVAQDWSALRFMGQWQGERHAPTVGFIVQAAIALALIVFGALEKDGFSTMVEFTAPVFWFFFMLSGIALLVLRRRDPERARPFRVPLYPVLPLLFVATCAYLLYSSITYAQSKHATYVALIVMISGAVVLLGLRFRKA
ncbi:amino acid transporter [Steroidobacter agaridevorans]|uniref:Amino acid transporter n=1 Tax=Steroidobacter agaridevorans TaxID=2695856 RepID=A0A829YHC1_9GAMM|nr:amino acid permease [Steroidobacter agaridevorans]GFE82221.1 amino acid transporter [Steroidobacter agaridevorans]